MACLTFEIREIYPLKANELEGLSVIFKVDDKQREEQLPLSSGVTLVIDNVKQQIKIVVRLKKNGCTLGVGETLILQPSIGRRDQSVGKIINITINDTSKKLIFKSNQIHSYMNYLKINMQVGVKYLYSGTSSNPEIQVINRSVSDNNTSNKTNFQMNANNSSNTFYSTNYNDRTKINSATNIHGPHRTQSVDSATSPFLQAYEKTKFSVKKASLSQSQGKQSLKSPNKEPEENKLDITNSVIDTLINHDEDDNYPSGDTVDSLLLDIQNTYNDVFLNCLPLDSQLLKSDATFLIEKLFLLQETYYRQFGDSIKLNKNLKELLIKYNEKFRITNKKNHRLQERLESLNIRTNLTTFVNREEAKRVSDTINNNMQREMRIFRDIFKVEYDDKQVLEYAEEKSALNEKSDKSLLLKVFKNISKNRATSSILNKDETINFNILKAKYQAEINQDELFYASKNATDNPTNANAGSRGADKSSLVEEGKADLNKYELSEGSEDGLEIHNIKGDAGIYEEEKPQQIPQPQQQTRKRSSVVTNNPDVIDKRLDSVLGDLYKKKRISQIPFRKISTGYYDYGTQKVMVKLEGETVRVRTGGGFILLDKFIEVNAPVEEARKVNVDNITNKYKQNVGMQKVMSPNKPVYAIHNGVNNPMSVEKATSYKVQK